MDRLLHTFNLAKRTKDEIEKENYEKQKVDENLMRKSL